MQPMNPVLPDGVGRLKVFIQDLVQVDQKTGMLVSVCACMCACLRAYACGCVCTCVCARQEHHFANALMHSSCVYCSTLHKSAEECSTVQKSAVQCRRVQRSMEGAVQCRRMQRGMEKCSAVWSGQHSAEGGGVAVSPAAEGDVAR